MKDIATDIQPATCPVMLNFKTRMAGEIITVSEGTSGLIQSGCRVECQM